MAERDPELAEAIRARMFTFDDVLALDDRTMQVVLRSLEISELALALKGISDDPEAVSRFTQNLSERGQAELAEEMEVMGPVRASQVDAAQSSLVRAVRELEASGAIVITRSTDELV
jgi:flagellar motor switch protein FliG